MENAQILGDIPGGRRVLFVLVIGNLPEKLDRLSFFASLGMFCMGGPEGISSERKKDQGRWPIGR